MIPSADAERLPQGNYRYSGTVLLRRDASGSSQSLLLLLRDLGLCWVSAPGANGRKGRFGGATEPFVWAEFCLYQSANGMYLQSAEVREDFLAVRSDPKLLLTAMRCYKRVKQTLMVGHESNQSLIILWNAMLALSAGCAAELAEFRFCWRLLRYLGQAPSLLECCGCGAPLKEELGWSQDGLLCSACGASAAPPGALADLQRAALLEQDRFVEWAKRPRQKKYLGLFSEQTKKLIIFFADLS